MLLNPRITSSCSEAVVCNVFSALIVHLLYNKYELDPARILPTALLLFGPPTAVVYICAAAFPSFTIALLFSFAVFYGSLFLSIICYRISPFHPLAKYPGPLFARMTKFYGLRKMSTGKNHIYYQELHKRYGSYVRVGPNEISVADASKLSNILGLSGLPKGPMWDGRRNPYGPRAIIGIRDTREHVRRRKPWSRAFSTSAVKDYEPAVLKRAMQLLESLAERGKGGTFMNLVEWMKSFAFDSMGDMVFGGGFETMRHGTENEAFLNVVEGGIKMLAMIQHIPWIVRALHMIPGASKPLQLIRKYSLDAVVKRKAAGSNIRDVMHHLMGEDVSEKERSSDAEVLSDAFIVIAAGYDTTATVLANAFYGLLRHQEDYARLRKEVDEYFPASEAFTVDAQRLAAMPFLNAVINEALRFGFPGNVLQRATTPETGERWFDDNYIPIGTAIDVPVFTLCRDPRYFSPAPEEFWPDRFLPEDKRMRMSTRATSASSVLNGAEEGVITNLDAFIPFSYGPANCAGKNLAILELRVVVALLVRHLDMQFADDYDPNDWERSKEDWFVIKTGPLPVVVSQRDSAKLL